MKKTIEKIAILSLSFVLTSMLAVSASIPILGEQFQQYSRSAVETLVSVPAFPMIIMVALSPFLAKFISERVTIIVGLLLVGIAGVAPAFLASYSGILIARIGLGIGIGLINTRAISIIGERWEGKERATLLGFRGSAETLGQTLMTLLAGQLLAINWKYSFFVYLIAIPILFLYLVFVPSKKITDVAETTPHLEAPEPQSKMSATTIRFILLNAALICLLIAINVSNALRIPSLVVEHGYGTDVNAGQLLSVMMFTGFLAGLIFGKLITALKERLLPVALLTLSFGLLIIGLSNQLLLTGIGAFICGFSATTCITYVFNSLSENLPKASLNTGMSIVLVGCNIGAFIAPYLMKIMGFISSSLSVSFFCYAGLTIAISIGLLFSKKTSHPETQFGNN